MDRLAPRIRFATLLILLLALILTPRWVAGMNDLSLAETARAAGDFSRAADLFLSAHARLPFRPDLLEQAAFARYLSGELPSALELFAQASNLSPEGQLTYARALSQTGDADSALQIWLSLESEGRFPAEIYPELANYYDETAKDDVLALQYYRLWLEQDALQARPHFRVGILTCLDTPVDAVLHLLEAARLDPAYDPEVQVLRTAINTALLEPDPAYQQLVIGRGLAALGEWTLAERAFARVVSLRPEYADGLAWLGEARYQLGGEYLPLMEQAARFAPYNASVWSMLGTGYQRAGAYESAEIVFEYLTRLEPQNPLWRAAYAQSLALKGDLPPAYENFVAATEMSPENAALWRLLGQFCLNFSFAELEMGLPAALRAYALEPQNPESLELLGRAMHANGDASSAETFFLRTLQTDPNSPAAHLDLGVLYLEQNRTAEARAQLEQVLALAPDSPEATLATRILEQYLP